ncbi:hypothetical protein GCM10022214_45020 [Actinomadura miaoliensis]|uniref:Uncharacterized protein n=1 Tax=Actinomadura miaoliensis TaxID=430685 RepID=A0ABP7W519_9ACTN
MLIRLRREGMNTDELSEHLGRHARAILMRLEKLGLAEPIGEAGVGS